MVCQNITAEYRRRLFDHRFDFAIGCTNFDRTFAEAAGGIGNGT
jgi:hypothetical protein